jgi:hypothetical protein
METIHMDKSKNIRNGRRSQSRFVWTSALICMCALSASYAIALLCAYALGWNTAPDFFASEFRICVTRTPMIEIACWLSAALAFYWGLSCFFSQQSLVWQLREVRDMNSAPRNVIPFDSANQVFLVVPSLVQVPVRAYAFKTRKSASCRASSFPIGRL